MDINYLPLFVVCVIAWIVPLLLSWLEFGKVPSVIIMIILGVIVGPYSLNWVVETPYMHFLSETGFLFLIFLCGLEIDVDKILSSLPQKFPKMVDWLTNSLLLALFIFIGTLVLSLLFAWLLSFFIDIDVLLLAILFPTVGLSIMVPILKADGELTRKFGQVLLMEGAIATIMCIILIALYSGIMKNGFRVELLLFVVIFVVFVITIYVGKRLVKIRTFQKLLYRLDHAASQIRVRGTVVLLLFFVIVSHLLDTEPIMGAFTAGLLLSLFVNKERSPLLFKLDGMSYGFFIPIFFIMVGVNLNLSALSEFQESIPFILTLIVGFFITQVVPAMVMTKLFGAKRALAGGILITARLGETIAIAQIGQELGIITTAHNAGIVAAALAVSIISPMAYKFFSNEDEDRYNIYILGGSRTSLLISERLKMHGLSCITILQNAALVPEFEQKGIPFRKVDKITRKMMEDLSLRVSDQVIILTESKLVNLEMATYIKNTLGHSKIILRKQSASHALLDHASEHFKLIDPEEILANHIEDMIVRPDSVASLAGSFDVYRVEEISITKQDVHRKLVKEIAFPPTGSLVIQKRGGEVFIPHGDTHLLLGDVLTVIGNSAALAEFREILE